MDIHEERVGRYSINDWKHASLGCKDEILFNFLPTFCAQGNLRMVALRFMLRIVLAIHFLTLQVSAKLMRES